jgi:hypothetical protein
LWQHCAQEFIRLTIVVYKIKDNKKYKVVFELAPPLELSFRLNVLLGL